MKGKLCCLEWGGGGCQISFNSWTLCSAPLQTGPLLRMHQKIWHSLQVQNENSAYEDPNLGRYREPFCLLCQKQIFEKVKCLPEFWNRFCVFSPRSCDWMKKPERSTSRFHISVSSPTSLDTRSMKMSRNSGVSEGFKIKCTNFSILKKRDKIHSWLQGSMCTF